MDFYCAEHKLIIELDGKVHQFEKEYDEIRTEVINKLGMHVVRFSNTEIKNNLEEVIQKLKKLLN